MSENQEGRTTCTEASRRVRAAGLDDPGCCDSCHDDFEAGYEPLPHRETPDGTSVDVCCPYIREELWPAVASADDQPLHDGR